MVVLEVEEEEVEATAEEVQMVSENTVKFALYYKVLVEMNKFQNILKKKILI
jgi:hypothetical protein